MEKEHIQYSEVCVEVAPGPGARGTARQKLHVGERDEHPEKKHLKPAIDQPNSPGRGEKNRPDFSDKAGLSWHFIGRNDITEPP
ncbi:hypothetical protein EVAR_47652_1 [Eumeta japonica]|uniref:Uncharacterized protein n=1 Tax=Eumeta variegata TaxID=151549 RepID=A0A4C1Y272_EUMVA|nr:hypothetical protein EVAR_47652_1 [Eumeta japonica]